MNDLSSSDPPDAQTIKAELFPDYTDLGQAGSVFIGVVVNGAITLLGAQGWTPYDGVTVTGWPVFWEIYSP